MSQRIHDAATTRMLASFARQREAKRASGMFGSEFEDDMTQAEIDAEELALFDRAESRAINSGANQ